MKSMREMFWLSVEYNFTVKVLYMPGWLQTIPDAISRMHEPNALLLVETLINNWLACHTYEHYEFKCFSLLQHMSLQSLPYILEQVLAWRGFIPWTVM